MSAEDHVSGAGRLSECNCLAIRQAARHVTQFYDQLFAPVGLRATQFAILSRLRRQGPMTINALAGLLVMDRTTLGRNILPLQRDGLIEIVASAADRRRRELRLTDAGLAKHEAALELLVGGAAAFRGRVRRRARGRAARAAARRGGGRLRRRLGQGGITPRKARRLASGEGR